MPIIRLNKRGNWYIRGKIRGEFVSWSPLPMKARAYIKKKYGPLYNGLSIDVTDITVMIKSGYITGKGVDPDKGQGELFWEDAPEGSDTESPTPPDNESKNEPTDTGQDPDVKPPPEPDSHEPQSKGLWQKIIDWFKNIFKPGSTNL